MLYERLVKRFQTPAERDAEGKKKGYGRTLEASLLRSENRLSELGARPADASPFSARDTTGTNDWDATPGDKAQGQELWRAFLEDRFVNGGDEEFDYGAVDGDEDLDELVRREEEEGWFESEEPAWAGAEEEERELKGETGIQDF